jgi:hypothetical protein
MMWKAAAMAEIHEAQNHVLDLLAAALKECREGVTFIGAGGIGGTGPADHVLAAARAFANLGQAGSVETSKRQQALLEQLLGELERADHHDIEPLAAAYAYLSGKSPV